MQLAWDRLRAEARASRSRDRAPGAWGGRRVHWDSPHPQHRPLFGARARALAAGTPGAARGPGRAPPPWPRSGLIRTTLQGSERFAREGEAPAPAARRRASEVARGCRWLTAVAIAGRAGTLGVPLTLWRSQIRLLERGEGGDIRCLPGAGRKGEGGKDPWPVCAEPIQTKTKRLKEQRPGRHWSPSQDPRGGAPG